MNSLAKKRAFFVLLLVAIFALALSACGKGSDVDKSAVLEGQPIALGPLQYNVLFTRPLNIDDVEDSQYLKGQPDPEPGYSYIGVFVKIHNIDQDLSHTLPTSFELVDTKDNTFENIPSKSIYALVPGQRIPPDGDVPVTDSPAQVGPIQGSLLLFKMPNEDKENRPVQLVINGQDGPAYVDIDL